MAAPPKANPRLLAALLNVAAKTAQSGLSAYQQQAPGRPGAPAEPGCTPCAAMARRRKARRLVNGS